MHEMRNYYSDRSSSAALGFRPAKEAVGRKRFLLFMLLMAQTLTGATYASADAVDYDNQTITIVLAREPPQLNSMKTTDVVSMFVLGHVMEGLTTYDRRGNIAPGVAKDWEMTDTGATFHLREDAVWSDGVPVTAGDFVFAWRNALAPATASQYAFILYAVKNAEAINEGELPVTELGVRAIDDLTLEVDFERPVPYFLKLTTFSTYCPIRQDINESQGDRYAADTENMVYNGPFKITDWVHGASLRMRKNDHYWNRQNIRLNGIHVDYITSDGRTWFNLFNDGKIAFARLGGETYKGALSQGFRIKRFSTGAVAFIEFNHREGHPTANLNLRKAIQHVFDSDKLANKVIATPGNLPGKSLFPVWLDGVNGKFRNECPAPETKADTDKPLAYLTQAREQLGVEDIPALVLLVGDDPLSAKAAEYLQGRLKSRLGLELKIDAQTLKQHLAKATAGEFDLKASGWGPDFDDIMTFGDRLASWNPIKNGHYNNPEYDRLVRVAMNSSDQHVRVAAMCKVQDIIHEDVAILPLFESGQIYVTHPKLKGVVRHVVGADPDYRYARVVR